MLLFFVLLFVFVFVVKLQVYFYDGVNFIVGQCFDLCVEVEDVISFKDVVIIFDG